MSNLKTSRRTQKNVGVIGLGIIGQRVSERLRRSGFSVFVWNRTPRPFPNFVGSPAEIAQLADFIQIFVSDDAALLQTVEQLKMTLKAHHVVMAHCTVAPHTMREAAEIVQRRGAQFLDAPFTGSKLAAEKGELVYYIGGDEAAFRRAQPVLQASSKELIEIGEIGQATTIKIATNMVTAATVQVAAEALAVVKNAGMSLEKFALAMRGNASNSATLAMKLPKMMAGDFDPHFSVKHMLKDVEIANRLANSHGVSLGATVAARDSLREEVRQGRGNYDYTSLVRVLIPPTAEAPMAAAAKAEQPLLDLKEGPPEKAGKASGETLSEEEPKANEPEEPEHIEEPKEVEVPKEVEPTKEAPSATESIIAQEAPAAEVERAEEPASQAEPDLDQLLHEARAEGSRADSAVKIADKSERTDKDEAVPEKEDAAAEDEETPDSPVPEQERRGFFSRMFSKTASAKDADY